MARWTKASRTVSNKWYDGTMVCHKSDVERPDIWVIKADVEKGLTHLNEQKSIKYILYSLKDMCKCGNYHRLTKVVLEPEQVDKDKEVEEVEVAKNVELLPL